MSQENVMSREKWTGPLVRYEGISKTYDGRFYAIKDFALDIAAGEFLTMLGPSGSGKTTLLTMLAGFEMPSGGQISVRGRSVSELPAHKRNIGMVFQNYALFPHMSVADNIGYPLRVRGLGRAEIAKRVARALDMVQLSGFGERKPGAMSGGQQQRVALARAMVFNPDLVLMDEPLGALDKMLREEMQYEIKKLHTEVGVTIVYVTHDQSEAMVMSDRVAILRGGKLQQLAPPRQLYEAPSNAFVANFIGENNRLLGRLRRLEGNHCAVEMPGSGDVHCVAGDLNASSDQVYITVRPERTHVSKRSVSVQGENCFPARIKGVTFLGEAFRIELELEGGGSLIAKMQNTGQSEPFSVDEVVNVSWARSEAFAFGYDETLSKA
ncbi:ABC transporter ATP-binding protein [Ensifer sp. ENS07]|uniref:ABC transporter ATP-binding protein n=1 Tax=Ensifer sp. ENS07 TaxID=2769274 RepID=UPI00177C35F6|nr:ABC transporter ATP-binding protein [Ensifer sp. ENS07]MBD9641748.1 ABC transporter ATP-binding protein [Ensifer sp. ENS07]